MARALLVLSSPDIRQKAMIWLSKAPIGTRVEFKGPKRTLPQNDRMWAMLTDVAEQLLWHGKPLSTDDWKLMFLDALHRARNEELRIVPNIDNSGFVNLSTSSSDLDKQEMSDLMEIITAFGSSHGVVFSGPRDRKFAASSIGYQHGPHLAPHYPGDTFHASVSSER